MGFSPQEHSHRLTNGDSVAIIDRERHAVAVKVTQDAYLAHMSETFVRGRTFKNGELLPRSAHWRFEKAAASRGVIEVENGVVNVRVSSFSKTGRMQYPGTLLEVASHFEVLPTLAEEEVHTVAA